MRAVPPLLALLAALPACGGAPVTPDPAREEPAPAERGGRVTLAVGTAVGGEARAREVQRTLWEAMQRFELRVECLVPFRDEALEAAAREAAARAEREDPGAPVAVRVTGQVQASYADSAFYGQPLAHNFHGQVEVLVTDGEGQPLRRIEFLHSWGRLRQARSLEATLGDWEEAVHTAVLVGVMGQEKVRAAVPARRRAELDAWLEDQRQRTLTRLERSIPESEVVALLRAWAP